MDWHVAQTRNLHSRKSDIAIESSPPIIGRSAVLARLFSSEAQLLVLVGEPGIGKSRILSELRRGAAPRDSRYVSVNCLQANQAIPFEPLTSLARRLRRRNRINDGELRNFIESRGSDRVWYFRELVEAALSGGPLTLQVDDGHWADVESVDAILCSLDRLQESPVQCHLAMRSGNTPLEGRFIKLASQGLAHIERLEGLTLEHTMELARAVLPPETHTRIDPLKLWNDSNGNPLYIEYCAQAEAFGRRPTRGSRRQLFEQRISAVPNASADICSWLAVSGRPVPQATIAALTGFSVDGVALLLEELECAGIISVGSEGPSFRHALIRDACYGLLDDAERRRRHRALVHYADNDWHRVLHLDGAGLVTDAAVVYNRLGWRHIDAAEPERALTAFTDALERVPAADRAAEEARSGHAIALMWLGRTADAMRAWQDFQQAQSSPMDSLSVTAGVRLAEAAWENGEDVDTALPVLCTALGNATSLAPHLLPRILLLLGAIHERRDDLGAAQAYLERGLVAAESVANSRDSIRLRSWLAVVKARLGDSVGGTVMLEAVVDRAEALQYANDVAHACVKLCYLADMAGDHERYARWCRRGLQGKGPASTHLRALLMTNLASVETDAGNLRSALSNAESAEHLTSAAGGNLVARSITQQAFLHAVMGNSDAATACIARARRQRLTQSWMRAVEYTRGVVAEVLGDYEAAREAYEATLPNSISAILTEVFELRALTGIVRTACNSGDLDDAKAKLLLLRGSCHAGWRISDSLLAEAQGLVSLAVGEVAEGCAHLVRAQETAPYRLRQLTLGAKIAEARVDRRALTSCIAALEQIEANGLAATLRTHARALGMRPGRCRLQQGVLTDREIDVARYVASGKTNGEIARTISVTRRTVEFHVANIFRKLDLNSRVELAAMLASGAVSGAEMIRQAPSN
jgi:DNA-binding CsgD family transcriptional regulator